MEAKEEIDLLYQLAYKMSKKGQGASEGWGSNNSLLVCSEHLWYFEWPPQL